MILHMNTKKKKKNHQNLDLIIWGKRKYESFFRSYFKDWCNLLIVKTQTSTTFNSRTYFTEPSIRKKSFAKAQLPQRHWMHFFILELKTLTPKQKKSSLVILTKKKIFYTFFTIFDAVKLQSYKIAQKSFYYIFDSYSL